MAYYNKEHYKDSTAGEAISNVTKQMRATGFKPLVFICSPYAGDTEKNVQRARTYSRYAIQQGYLPLAPHLLFPQFLNDSCIVERDLGCWLGLILLGKCHEVWVFGDNITKGMSKEIYAAGRQRKPIRYFKENLKEITSREGEKNYV